MSSNILLVNIRSKTRSFSRYDNYASPALLKLSTLYKNQGNTVELVEAGRIPKAKPDIICFSTIFLFNLKKEMGYIQAYQKKFPNAKIRIGGISASLRPDLFERKVPGSEIHIGLNEEIEKQIPDYDIINMPYSTGFITRGCVNKCKWCVVPKLEGPLSENPHWKNNIKKGHPFFSAMDNNILAFPPGKLNEILLEMHNRNMKIDFNQAMDAVPFAKDEEYARVMARYPQVFKNIRFAWDSKRQNKYVPRAIELLNKYKIRSEDQPIWYMLYGFKDPPQEIYERMRYLLENKQKVKGMRYRNIETGAYDNSWNGIDILFASFFSKKTRTGIADYTLLKFNALGHNYEEFLKISKSVRLYAKAFKKIVRRKEFGHIIQLSKKVNL